MVDIPPRWWWWLLFKRGSHVTPFLEAFFVLRKHRDPPSLPFLDWAALGPPLRQTIRAGRGSTLK